MNAPAENSPSPDAKRQNVEDQVYHLVESGVWQIDAEGRLWKSVPGQDHRVEETRVNAFGYRFTTAGRRKICLVHRLVWRHLRGPIQPGMLVTHRNGELDDNRIENLELRTHEEQALRRKRSDQEKRRVIPEMPPWLAREERRRRAQQPDELSDDARDSGQRRPRGFNRDWVRSETSYQDKLTEDQVRSIWKDLQRGASIKIVAKKHRVSRAAITVIKYRVAWRKLTDTLGTLPGWSAAAANPALPPAPSEAKGEAPADGASAGNEELAYELVRQGVWEISPEGKIIKRKPGDVEWRAVRVSENVGGYLTVSFRHAGRSSSCMLHRLLWRHFVGPIPAGLTVNHKNGVKTDNRLDNLELMTPAENARHGVHVLKALNPVRGQDHYRAKLSEQDVREIWQHLQHREDGTALAEWYDVSVSMIWRIKHRKAWRHVTDQLEPMPPESFRGPYAK